MKTKLMYSLIFCIVSTMTFAQQKLEKTKKSINANKEVTIDLNTSYVEIEVDTWDKNTVEIEAYIESSKLSKEELQKALKNWNLEISGSGDYIKITSQGSYPGGLFDDGDYANILRDLEVRLADLPEMPEMPKVPQMPNMPKIPEMPEMPELPELPAGVKSVSFDYEKYKEQGDAYLEKWSKEYDAKVGKDYKEKMKAWAKKFEESGFQEKMEKWGEEFGKRFEGKWAKDMEAWGEKFGEKFGEEWEKKMEAWGENFEKSFGKDMEAWGERFAQHMERQAAIMERNAERQEALAERQSRLAERNEEHEVRSRERGFFDNRSNSNVKKVIKIKMPKKAKLKLNVRHGELKMSSVIYNADGQLSYSKLLAQSIDGSKTSINAAYSSVLVNNWLNGSLGLKFVDEALLKNVSGLTLNATSSNINIDYLSGNTIIDGSFGELTIHNILDTFNTLNIIIENSEAWVKLPKTDFSLMFNGERSQFNNEATKKKIINGSSGKSIVVNAKFSSFYTE